MHGAKNKGGDDSVETPIRKGEGFGSAFDEGELDVAGFGFCLCREEGGCEGVREEGREEGRARGDGQREKREEANGSIRTTDTQEAGCPSKKTLAHILSSYPPPSLPPFPTCATLNASLFKCGSKPITSHPNG